MEDFKLFNELIAVSAARETGLITLTVDWEDSVQAAKWANTLVQRLNLFIKDQKVEEANNNMDFLNKQLNSTNKAEDRTILYDLIESNTKTIMLANVTDEFAFKVLDPAFVPEERLKPKRKKMVMIGGMVGLMMGIGLAFLMNYVMEKHEGNAIGSE